MVKEFVIDLFCGAGGTSTGIHFSNKEFQEKIKFEKQYHDLLKSLKIKSLDTVVTACVNHDAKAIESHRLNHPWAKHFIEDIRNPEVVFFLKIRVDALRKLYPGCIITIWASLECTNFSKAKGGLPRDADSRTLANHLFMYLDSLQPDYLMIENVEEFMSWGPLDENGKPVSKKRGVDYLNWVEQIKSREYQFDYRILNAADFGAFTSRRRYFAQFAKNDLPIVWPEQTHCKNPEKEKDLFSKPLKKWKAVKEVLDFKEEGISIFNRKKPLVENTLKRIYAGLLKFVANGDESFIQKNFSGRPWGKVVSVDGPAGTILTNGSNQALVDCHFLLKYNSMSKKRVHIPPSIDDPCPTVAVQGRLGVVNFSFLNSYYGNGGAHSVDEPCPTVSTKDRFSKIEYFMMNYSSGQKVRSVNYPAGTIVANDKHNLVDCWIMPTSFDNKGRSTEEPAPTVLAGRKHHYLINPQYNNTGNSIENPCPVIIARQDKKPLGIIICETSNEPFAIPIYDDDTETMVKIKQFMAAYGIVDIKMRMLLIKELLRIQGFPVGYRLIGTQTDQKKFIGNSVEVTVAKMKFEAHHNALIEYFELKKVA